MLRLIDTVQVGPQHAGHTRTIYGGDGMEVWHETIVPANPFRSIDERVLIYVAELPPTPPQGCTHSKLVEPFYGDGLIPEIAFNRSGALDRAIASLGLVFEEE